MNPYDLSRVADDALLRDAPRTTGTEFAALARGLAHIAEIDERKLYLPRAHSSMLGYCVAELRLTEDEAYKRITVARTARRFPEVFPALADGRLSLTSVLILGPHLTPENAAELVKGAAGRSKAGIQELLAARFPRTESIPMIVARPSPQRDRQLAPERVAAPASPQSDGQLAPERVEVALPSVPAAPVTPAPRIAPISAASYDLRLSIGQETYDLLSYAQALLGHSAPTHEIARLFHDSLKARVAEIEKRKFGATSRPRRSPNRPSTNPRHIPVAVKCAVWKRDQGRCAFVSDAGHRCQAKIGLEYDHVTPVARGGTAAADNIRLLCRAHNQYAADQTYGTGFMKGKREGRRAEEAKNAAAERSA